MFLVGESVQRCQDCRMDDGWSGSCAKQRSSDSFTECVIPFPRSSEKEGNLFPMRKRRNTLEAAGNDLSRSEERTTTGQENVRNEQGEAGIKQTRCCDRLFHRNSNFVRLNFLQCRSNKSAASGYARRIEQVQCSKPRFTVQLRSASF